MAPLTLEDLKAFTGDLVRTRHPLFRRIIYTPGVEYLAEAGEAYWLVDEIAGYLCSREFAAVTSDNPRIGEMHFWRLSKKADGSAELAACEDSDIPAFYSKAIPWTDFPLDAVDIWAAYDGEHWTLYLPSEH